MRLNILKLNHLASPRTHEGAPAAAITAGAGAAALGALLHVVGGRVLRGRRADRRPHPASWCRRWPRRRWPRWRLRRASG